MMRKIYRPALITVLLFYIFAFLASAEIYASDIEITNTDTSYEAVIEDDAGILSDTDRVMKSMIPITGYGNVCLKTIDENDTTAASYAEKYLHGRYGRESATVFLIDMDNRKIYIFSDGAIYRTVTNSKAEVITDNIYTYATYGDYDSCAIKAFNQMQTLLDGGKIAEPMHIIGIALISLLLGMIICFVIIWSSTKKKKIAAAELIKGTDTSISITEPTAEFVRTRRTYSPVSSGGGSSGGSSFGGGGSPGGSSFGGGGGGSSGGGGGHSF